jgi:predicted hotdog family 3-hydroxylacyl-ACP dehydratase
MRAAVPEGFDLEELLPHRAPMILIDRVLGVDGEEFRCGVSVRPESPFFEDGAVPAWVGLEYMAQAVGALAGCEGKAKGAGARPGLLLGARAYISRRENFRDGEELTVAVREVLRQDGGISVMECFIRDRQGVELAQAQLTLVQLPGEEAFKELMGA